MDYEERPAPPSLQRHLQCLWRLRGDASQAPVQTIYPDGRCELIVHLGAPMRRYTLQEGWRTQARCLFAAQMRVGIRLGADARIDCIGLRLTPAASALVVGEKLSPLTDTVVDLQAFDSAFATALIECCVAFASDEDPAALWRLLESRLAGMPLDPLVERAVAAIDAVHGDLDIAQLTEGASRRSLQIRFRRSVGLTAKEYARVQRLQAMLRQLDGNSDSLCALSLDSGFADQAHATRELRRLTGLTPGKLRRALLAEREGDASLRLAAAFVRGHARS